MKHQRIVSTGVIDDIAIGILEKFAPVQILPSQKEEMLLAHLDGTIGIVLRGYAVSLTRCIISSAKALKVIGRTGAGYDKVDIEAATDYGIPVVYAPGMGAFAVAEGTMAMFLALSKRLFFWDSAVKDGKWELRSKVKNRDMEGMTMGIIGLGRIGSEVAHLSKAFRMRILGFDPYLSPGKAKELSVQLVSLEELLRESDCISIHAPLTPETRGLINHERLKQVKHGAILVNMARGDIVENLDVLFECLEDGRLEGVGLDVFPNEPPKDVNHPIFSHPGFLVTPHVLGITYGADKRVCCSTAEDMVAVFQGKRPRFVVNPEVLSSQRCQQTR